MHLQPAGYPRAPFQSGAHRGQTGAGRGGQRAGCQRVAQIVRPDQSGLDRGYPGRAMKFKAEAGVDSPGIPGAKVAVTAEAQDGPAAQLLLPVIGKRRAGGNNAHAVRRQGGHQNTLLAGDVFHVAQPFEVRRRCVQQCADRRPRDSRQACDIAGPAGAEFKHGGIVRVGKVPAASKAGRFRC